MDHSFKSKWESKNFMFDEKDGDTYPGFSWPQRNFMCNFCNKEYKSAQALGGHMNVHRRDRARLRLSSPPSSLDHPNVNPNPNPNYGSPPSPVRYLPYNTNHSPVLPLVSATNVKDEAQKFVFRHSARDFLGCMRKKLIMENEEDKNGKEIFSLGFVKDDKIEVDLELRLGRP